MAKFKKGDRVVATEPNYHTRGIGVVRGYEYSWDEEIERDDPGWYIVDFPNQYKVKMGKGSLRPANAARSRNDVLGRYKPGVRVDVELRTRPIVGKVMQYGGRPEVEYSPTMRTRFTGTLIKQNGNKWDIKSDSGEVYKSVSEADFGLSYNAARSRNAYAVDKKGRPIKSGMMLKDDDGDKFRVGRVLRGNIVEDEWGNQRLETNRWAEIVQNSIRSSNAVVQKAMNAQTSVLRETAVNGVWETESKLEREIARTVGADIDVGIYGSAIAIGGVPDEDSAGKVKDIVARMFGPVASWKVKKDIIGYTIHAKVAKPVPTNSSRSTNAVVAKAMNAQAVCNASYSAALKAIMDAVKPYMDRRITDDTSWRYPALVISKLRDVCERAVMSAGRYDGKRPPHRVYDVECVKDGFKFSGNLIVSGLLHRDDQDDVSAFDEYDMILSLGYAGKA